jgi:hypothetical protein
MSDPLSVEVYFDFRDWWVGYYRGDQHHYVCVIPTLVVRWRRYRTTPLDREASPETASFWLHKARRQLDEAKRPWTVRER